MDKGRILITGATGYIGNCLCQRLIAQDWDVSVLLRKDGSQLPLTQRGRVVEYHYDGSIDSIYTGINKSRPQIIIHLATYSISEHRSEDVDKLINTNILFSSQLIEAAYRSNVSYFINTGTSWQHYRKQKYDPVCLYAATKQAFEDILDFYADACAMKIITLKLFDTYGPGDKRSKIFNLIKGSIIQGYQIELSPGGQTINLTHVDDVVDSFLISIDRLIEDKVEKNHEKFSIYSGENLTIKELIKRFEEVLNVKIRVKFGARDYRSREVMMPVFMDNGLPGWRQKIDLTTGISSIISDELNLIHGAIVSQNKITE